MKIRFIAALFIACMGAVSLKGQSNTHEKKDSILIAEFLNKLNQFHITGDIEKIKYLHLDLWELEQGNKYINYIDWEIRLDRRITLYLELIKAINEKADLDFDIEASRGSINVTPPCDVYIDGYRVLFPDPEQILDDNCRTEYMKMIRAHKAAEDRNWYNYNLILLYEELIGKIVRYFERSDFLSVEDVKLYVPPIIEKVYVKESLKERLKQDLGLD